MEKSGNFGKKGEDAHHIFPQKFRKEFKELRIDIDDAKYGKWMNVSKHRSGARAYNELWDMALKAHIVTEKNAIIYAKIFMKVVYDTII